MCKKDRMKELDQTKLIETSFFGNGGPLNVHTHGEIVFHLIKARDLTESLKLKQNER